MLYDIAYSSPLLLLAEGVKSAPTRFILLRDGDIGWLGLDAKLTAAGARLLIAHFGHEGHDVPIDYHHSSVHVEDAQQGKSPAAGWIKELEYIEGEGLYASVIEWSATAKAEIEHAEFKYLSPVIRVNRDTGEVGYLHSVALTNRPRTKDQRELLAAAERLDEEFNMNPNARKQRPKKGTSRMRLVKGAATIEEGQLDEDATNLLAELMVALQDKGAELPDDAPIADVLQAALDAVKRGPGNEEDEAAKKATDERTAKEEVDKKAAASPTKEEDAIAAEAALKVAAFDGMNTRLKALEGVQSATRIDSLIEQQVQAGKLLPDDEKLMKAARTMAEADEDKFATFFGAMPAICEPGQLVTGDGDKGKAGNKREKLIAGAARQWLEHPKARPGVKCASWVNTSLRDEGLELLTAGEAKHLKEEL